MVGMTHPLSMHLQGSSYIEDSGGRTFATVVASGRNGTGMRFDGAVSLVRYRFLSVNLCISGVCAVGIGPLRPPVDT